MQNTLEWVRTNFLSDLLVSNVLFYSVYCYSRGSVAALKHRSVIVKWHCFVWEGIKFFLFSPAFCSSVMKMSFATSCVFQFSYCIAEILLLACLVLFSFQPSSPWLFHVKKETAKSHSCHYSEPHFQFAASFPWYKFLVVLNEKNKTSLSHRTV